MASEAGKRADAGPPYRIRRATVDDLEALARLWLDARLPADELHKQFTDFQVAVDPSGRLLGAIAMQIIGGDGCVHSEAFVDFGLADALRPLLWARLQSVARNNGLFRLWTQEIAPFWKKGTEFSEAAEDVKQKLPPAFGPPGAPWLFIRLREDAADPEALDRQFAMFREMERAHNEAIARRGQVLKWIGMIIAVGLFIGAICVLFYVVHGSRPLRLH